MEKNKTSAFNNYLYNRVVTTQWLMQTLYSLHDYDNEKLHNAMRKNLLYGSVTWEELREKTVETTDVIMVLLMLLAQHDELIVEMVDAFIKGDIQKAFDKAKPYFERLRMEHGNIVWMREMGIV